MGFEGGYIYKDCVIAIFKLEANMSKMLGNQKRSANINHKKPIIFKLLSNFKIGSVEIYSSKTRLKEKSHVTE